jgi:hypothetical protein
MSSSRTKVLFVALTCFVGVRSASFYFSYNSTLKPIYDDESKDQFYNSNNNNNNNNNIDNNYSNNNVNTE